MTVSENRTVAAASSPLGVRVHAARLAFDGKVLFDDLDFELAAGHWTCILGPSGVGKSSLLRLIAGLSASDQSSRVEGDDQRPLAGRAAYMGQSDLLLPWLDVVSNVTLGARLRGEAVDRARALSLIELVGLADYARARPDALSGGMRQRAALARTLMEDRPVVLMDEPFSALDAITRVRMGDLAARLLAGRTVLLVTHDPLEALRLGHRIHVMAGRPATLGPAMAPDGAPPRDLHDTALLALQGDLLARLAEAAS